MKKTSLESLNEQLAAAGVEEIKDFDPCPERTRYIVHLQESVKDDDWVKLMKELKAGYIVAFYKHFATEYPHLLFEIGEDKSYWNYNDETGVYDELNFSTVRGLVIKLLIYEGFEDKGTEAIAKNILGKYRSVYSNRGRSYGDFDNNSDWFHASNGWLNLITREFEPHTPERISRLVSAVDYDPKATCPLYDEFLDKESQMPTDQVRVIDQFSGYILTDTIEAEEMLIFEGRPGSGKSMVPEIWMKVLGKKAMTTSLKRIGGDSEFNGDELVDRTLCFIDEANPKTKDINESFQNLVTQPTIRVERKGVQGKIYATNKLKLVMCLNEMPDHMPPGMHRRYRHILFTRSFYDEGIKDSSIRTRIIDNELPGVLNRMLVGLKDYKKMGSLTIIENEALRKYEYDIGADDFSAFLSEHFEPVKDDEVRYSFEDMRNSFIAEFPKKYNQELSIQSFNKKLLSNRLPEFSKISKGRTKTSRGYMGIKLKNGHSFSDKTEKIKTVGEVSW